MTVFIAAFYASCALALGAIRLADKRRYAREAREADEEVLRQVREYAGEPGRLGVLVVSPGRMAAIERALSPRAKHTGTLSGITIEGVVVLRADCASGTEVYGFDTEDDAKAYIRLRHAHFDHEGASRIALALADLHDALYSRREGARPVAMLASPGVLADLRAGLLVGARRYSETYFPENALSIFGISIRASTALAERTLLVFHDRESYTDALAGAAAEALARAAARVPEGTLAGDMLRHAGFLPLSAPPGAA